MVRTSNCCIVQLNSMHVVCLQVHLRLQALNDPHQTAAFNFPTEFKHYKEVLLTPNFKGGKLGKTVVFDMDMSVGDFVALFYLLKIPREILNVQVRGSQ